jgi:hypothetical protein
MPSDAFPDDLETLQAMLLAEQCESERLRQIIKEMQRHRFGRRAETLPEDQMLLGLEDVEQMAASDAATEDQLTPGRASRTSCTLVGQFNTLVVELTDTNPPTAFRIDGFASAVPEASTWAMMILGFARARSV